MIVVMNGPIAEAEAGVEVVAADSEWEWETETMTEAVDATFAVKEDVVEGEVEEAPDRTIAMIATRTITGTEIGSMIIRINSTRTIIRTETKVTHLKVTMVSTVTAINKMADSLHPHPRIINHQIGISTAVPMHNEHNDHRIDHHLPCHHPM